MKYLVKIYEHTNGLDLDDSENSVLYQMFDRNFENADEALEWCDNYCENMNNDSSEMVIYTYVVSNDEKELEMCEFFDKTLKYAVQMALNEPELAKKIYVDNMSPESVKQAYDDYNGEYEYGDEE